MNKTALITGGSRGIGAETVRLFSKEGYNTAFIYEKSDADAEKIAIETGALKIKADIGNVSDIKKSVDIVHEKFGLIDALVCNAGISQFSLFTDISQADWERMLRINLSGAFYTAQSVVPDMIHNKSGSIVFVSSIWGITGASCEVHYSTVKAGLIGLSKSLAKELGPSGIRVNCVAPGVIDTDMNASLDELTKEQLCEETPLGKIGSPRDIAESILFLSSERASFITGQVLSPNGGIVI